MKIVSNVKVESATGRFMVDMRCSYWFGGLNCSPCLIPYEDLEVIIGELRYAQLWLKRRAKLWESYEKVYDNAFLYNNIQTYYLIKSIINCFTLSCLALAKSYDLPHTAK